MARARARGDRDSDPRTCAANCADYPPQDPKDPGYRRLRYTRYADDHLLGFTGPKAEAEAIKISWRGSCATTSRWNCTPDKTLITHARTRAARFLGYEIIVQHCNEKITRGQPVDQRGRRAARAAGRDQGQVRPLPAPRQTLAPVRTVRTWTTTTSSRPTGPNTGASWSYYLLAADVWRLGRLHWHAETSMLKTLGAP